MYKVVPIVAEARQWPCESKWHPETLTLAPAITLASASTSMHLTRSAFRENLLAGQASARATLQGQRGPCIYPTVLEMLWHSRKGSLQHWDVLCNMQIGFSSQMRRLRRCRRPWEEAACGHLAGTINEGWEEWKPVPFLVNCPCLNNLRTWEDPRIAFGL